MTYDLIPLKHSTLLLARPVRGSVVVAGDGELRETVGQLGVRLLGDRFRLVQLGRDRMPGLYRCADVFLHMSLDEPFGNVYVEALATGLPIVTHDRAVTRWALEDSSILVDTMDPKAVAHGIRDSLARRSPNEVRSRRDIVERRYAWTRIAAAYHEFLQGVCAQ